MIEVRHKQVSFEQVSLSDKEAIQVALEVIDKVLGYPSKHGDTCFINEKNQLINRVEVSGGSHSWDDDTVLRVATEDDKAVLRVRTILRTLK